MHSAALSAVLSAKTSAPDLFTALPFALVLVLGALAVAGTRRRRPCRRCNGTGLIRPFMRRDWQLCPRCHGRTPRTPRP